MYGNSQKMNQKEDLTITYSDILISHSTGCPTSNLETLRAYISKSIWLGTKILGAKCIICGYILFDTKSEIGGLQNTEW